MYVASGIGMIENKSRTLRRKQAKPDNDQALFESRGECH
mgnify:CR=1 FL=1